MTKARYRIAQIAIEGFRGFTSPQTINVADRNLFIFGPNGRGKSSIVEAVRWCLFGAPAGGDIEIRNTFYEPQECKVSLLLKGQDGAITVSREFRPGQDRESRQRIRDSSGAVLRASDALPQLARVGHHESAQVIFAAQHASGRQVPADISDFRTVLCFYLKLEDVPKLLTRLRELHEERTEESNKLAGELEKIEHGYRTKLAQLEELLASIRANPPWGDLDVPTWDDTEEKIRLFALQAARLRGDQVPSEVTPSQILGLAQKWIEAAALAERAERESRRNALRSQTVQADGLLATVRQRAVELEAAKTKHLQTQLAITALLDGQTEESLKQHVASLEEAKTQRDRRLSVAQAAMQTITAYPTVTCPACGTDLGTQLAQAIRGQCEHRVEDGGLLEQLQSRLTELTRLRAEAVKLTADTKSKSDAISEATKKLDDLLGINVSGLDTGVIEQKVTEFKADLEALNQQLAEGESSRQRQLKKIRDLHQELKYHEYRDSIKALQGKLLDGLVEARDMLRQHRTLLGRLEEIRAQVEKAFKAALDRAIPTLDNEFTKVYTRLTEQLSYDLVRIHHDPERTGVQGASLGPLFRLFPHSS